MDTTPRVPCPHCPPGFRTFKNNHGLNVHIRRKHWTPVGPIQPSRNSSHLSPTVTDPCDTQTITPPPPGSSILDCLAEHKMQIRVLKRIPKGARPMAADKMSSLIEKAIRSNSTPDWYSLLSFSYTAFRIPERRNHESLTSAVKNNMDGPCTYLPREVSLRPLPIYKLIETKVHDGDLGGAAKLLTSDCSLAPADENTFALLQEKHPAPISPMLPPKAPDSGVLVITVSTADVAGALASFHASSAAGLDGLRPQHLKQLVVPSVGESGTRLLESLTRLCNFLFKGCLNEEVCPFLYGASLCALNKKDGGIRPIAVGSVLRRLVAKLGCRAVREEMSSYLLPHQLGFGTPLGCEAAIHATRVFTSDPQRTGDVILKLDLKNAFNSLERGVMLAEVRENIPSLYPFLLQCYASPSHLHFNGQRIASQVGAQQGDPLGPLVFSLAIHKIISSLETPLNCWYLDDGIIGGAPDVVAREVSLLIPKLQEIGLVVNSSKCEFYPCSKDETFSPTDELQQLIPGMKIVGRENFTLLGAPIFREAVPSTLTNKTSTITQVQDHLGQLPAHIALTLFRSCLSLPKMTYILRTSPTWLFPEEVDQLDETVKSTLETILNVQLGDTQWTQASLPIRHGGLGVRRVRDTNLPAFLASSHGVLNLVTKILPTQGDKVDIPFQDEATTAFLAMCPNSTSPENPSVQRHWDDQHSEATFKHLLEAATGADVARLKAVTRPESGAWLHALPSPHLGTILDDSTLRVAVALRLGCAVCEPHTCRCGATVETNGHHGLSCGKSAGRFPRHHMLNDIIRRALASVGVPSILEPPGMSRADGKRPDGATLVPWEKGRILVWDATCVSTFAPTHLPRTIRAAGSAAKWAADQKTGKYSNLSVGCYMFLPFAVEVAGTWCMQAKGFVKELGRRMRQAGEDPRSESYLVQRISLAVQRGNAASVMGTFESGANRGELFT